MHLCQDGKLVSSGETTRFIPQSNGRKTVRYIKIQNFIIWAYKQTLDLRWTQGKRVTDPRQLKKVRLCKSNATDKL